VSAVRAIAAAEVVFWDFDGVVKDSVEIKGQAFAKLFEPYGADVVSRVRAHHEQHGGVSRYDKIPQYLAWAGEGSNPERVQVFASQFAALVRQAVIDSPWVPGVNDFLHAQCHRQRFVLVTATPQKEIEDILQALDLAGCFRETHGSPTAKTDALRDVISRWRCNPGQCLMVGDAKTDFDAATENGVPFLLRRTDCNPQWQQQYQGLSFADLTHG
jgi:phosphoglycolate phosphatase-like HAD superfamily hydrolase